MFLPLSEGLKSGLGLGFRRVLRSRSRASILGLRASRVVEEFVGWGAGWAIWFASWACKASALRRAMLLRMHHAMVPEDDHSQFSLRSAEFLNPLIRLQPDKQVEQLSGHSRPETLIPTVHKTPMIQCTVPERRMACYTRAPRGIWELVTQGRFEEHEFSSSIK